MEGRIYQINVKPETPGERGLLKCAVKSANITLDGIKGDFNRYRHEERHDDPDMALLLMSLETIQKLNAEGWPIKPGDIGENMTTSGIPYESFAPSKKYSVGGAIIQISKRCDPCSNLYLLPYTGKEKGATFLKTMMGRRGWYAKVIKEGSITTGDLIQELLPE